MSIFVSAAAVFVFLDRNDLHVDFWSTDITREQFKRSLKSWLFECAYGRRRVWETVQSEDAPKKWTYLLTYLLTYLFYVLLLYKFDVSSVDSF